MLDGMTSMCRCDVLLMIEGGRTSRAPRSWFFWAGVTGYSEKTESVFGTWCVMFWRQICRTHKSKVMGDFDLRMHLRLLDLKVISYFLDSQKNPFKFMFLRACKSKRFFKTKGLRRKGNTILFHNNYFTFLNAITDSVMLLDLKVALNKFSDLCLFNSTFQ
jgi:hypothetical protein